MLKFPQYFLHSCYLSTSFYLLVYMYARLRIDSFRIEVESGKGGNEWRQHDRED